MIKVLLERNLPDCFADSGLPPLGKMLDLAEETDATWPGMPGGLAAEAPPMAAAPRRRVIDAFSESTCPATTVLPPPRNRPTVTPPLSPTICAAVSPRPPDPVRPACASRGRERIDFAIAVA
jgi:hypothetical protein